MIAVLSEKISEEFEKITKIKSFGLKSFENLDFPVNTHADMLICKIENTVFCYEKYYYSNKEIFDNIESLGYKINLVSKECNKNYPNDIALNVLVMGKTIFCKVKNTANELLTFAKENGYKIVDVKQGYSACSTLVLDENHAITIDKTIEKALKNENKEVILISSENIRLDGYNCGFIGGSCGVYDNKFFIFGKLDRISEHEKIEKLLKKLNFEKTEILNGEVYDFGGVKFF